MRIREFRLLSLVTLFILESITASAQNTFPKAGAHWSNNHAYGVFHSYVAGDTTLLGVPCKKVIQKALTEPAWKTVGITVEDLPILYLYSAPDTIFVYNPLFGKFTPLYVFNVAVGDTVRLPIFLPGPGKFAAPVVDSTFRFVVDSIKTVAYDTAHLKTVYSHSITTDEMVYRWGATVNAYAERIGSVHTGLLPHCASCSYLANDNLQLSMSVRCYTDSSNSIYLVNSDCYKGIPTAITPDPVKAGTFGIAPNPAHQVLRFSNASNEPVHSLAILSLDGRLLQYIPRTYNHEIAVGGLPDGQYFLRINTQSSSQSIPFIIQH